MAVILFLWSAIGLKAAITLGVKEDVSLLIAGWSGWHNDQTRKNSSEKRHWSYGLYLKIYSINPFYQNQFDIVYCPIQECKSYGISGKGDV
jgi:hypothetical protein